MEFVALKIDSPEWEYMWDWVANHPINKGIENPSLALNTDVNEGWQYMGSRRQNKIVIHELRHRCHPYSQKREDLKLRASENMNDNDIQLVKRM